MDGAGFWRHHFQITLPLVRPIMLVALLFGVVFAFTDMVVIFVLTRGGPYDTTQVLASLAFFTGIQAGDVAEGAATALEKGGAGQRYFLCGENVDLNGFYARLQDVAGLPAPTRHLPYAAARAAGYAMYLWAELTGLPPRLTHEVVGVLREHWAYSSAKAERELGYRSRPLAEGLVPTVAWLRGRLAA